MTIRPYHFRPDNLARLDQIIANTGDTQRKLVDRIAAQLRQLPREQVFMLLVDTFTEVPGRASTAAAYAILTLAETQQHAGSTP
jgi:hypothetical protein